MAGRRARGTGKRADAMLYGDLLELRITSFGRIRLPARAGCFRPDNMLNMSIFASSTPQGGRDADSASLRALGRPAAAPDRRRRPHRGGAALRRAADALARMECPS